ncbi:Uncharacterised protein [Prevotella disiens]|uniref:Uncharacterized protein n=1 Tax=Prevotella disiens TaxID=28130 RepID=A0A379DYJ2_9BACT|nr:Uncharacterised protein [Prevotella disiens]
MIINIFQNNFYFYKKLLFCNEKEPILSGKIGTLY